MRAADEPIDIGQGRTTSMRATARGVVATAMTATAVIAAAASPGDSAAVSPGDSAAASPGSVASTPSGGSELTDSTGRLRVTVPSDWTDTDVRPGIRDDGGRRPTISASPSLDGWVNGWTTPGMFATALPGDADPATLLQGYDFTGICNDEGQVAYDNGPLSGLSQTWSHCAGGETSVRHIAARAADGSFAVFLQLQLTSPDDPAGPMILDSLSAVPGANPGEESPIAAAAVVSGPADAGLIGVPVPDDAVTVSDELERISIAVSPGWTELDDTPGTDDDLTRRPHLIAAPNVERYRQDWSVEGLEAFVFPYRPDPATILANRRWAGGCDDGGLQSIELDGLSGLMQTWTNCGDLPTRMIAIAASPPDHSATVYLEVQLPTADDTALTTALSSLTLT